jgi:hypothetical protein
MDSSLLGGAAAAFREWWSDCRARDRRGRICTCVPARDHRVAASARHRSWSRRKASQYVR